MKSQVQGTVHRYQCITFSIRISDIPGGINMHSSTFSTSSTWLQVPVPGTLHTSQSCQKLLKMLPDLRPGPGSRVQNHNNTKILDVKAGTLPHQASNELILVRVVKLRFEGLLIHIVIKPKLIHYLWHVQVFYMSTRNTVYGSTSKCARSTPLSSTVP